MKCFIPKDPSLTSLELFQIAIVARGDIFRIMDLMFEVSVLLVMAKNIGGLRLIVVNEVFLQLIS